MKSEYMCDLCSEEFWCEFFRTLSSQSRDGAALVYVTSSLAQLPAIRVVDSVDAFRSIKHIVVLCLSRPCMYRSGKGPAYSGPVR